MDKKSNVLTKSELADIQTHLIYIKTHLLFVKGYYHKRLKFWKRLAQIKDLGSNLDSTANIEVLRKMEQNVEQLLTRIEEMGR